MVHAMHALRKRKSLILDTCEIFVKEPLLDWVKDAKLKKPSNKASESESAAIGSMLSEHEEELKELAWYPRKKIEIVKYKLNGLNPVKIIEREIKESRHEKRVIIIFDKIYSFYSNTLKYSKRLLKDLKKAPVRDS